MPARRQTSAPDSYWPTNRRRLFSLLIAAHLLAVIVPPLAFQASGPFGLAPSIASVMRLVQPYAQFMYLDRGYAFFAPDPGPSHLIQAGLIDASGELTELVFPNLDDQWPRLLYHRHFMLAEFLNDIHQPPGPPPELIQEDPQAAQAWRDARARYEHVRASIVRHLESQYPGRSVAIRRMEHSIPDVITFGEESIVLTDPRLYQVLLDDPAPLQSVDNFSAPVGPAESIRSPTGKAPEAAGNTDPEALP